MQDPREQDIEPSARSRFDVKDPRVSQQIDRLLEVITDYPDRELLREVFVTAAKLAEDGCSRGDLKILRSALKEMRHAFRVFAHHRDTPKVTIFGSARTLPHDPVYKTAVELGSKLARQGYMVITGAGGGVMGAGHQGAGREMSFGLNILLPFEQEANVTIANDEKLINFRYFFTRKLFFVKESKAIILMPGGMGTLDEGFETLTLVQTGKSDPVPIVMLDVPGGHYWKSWDHFVEKQLLDRGFISPEDRGLYRVTESVDQACFEIRTFYHRYHSLRYVDFKRILVIRLKEALMPDQIDVLNQNFADILLEGKIKLQPPHPDEEDEPELTSLPRLWLRFDQRHFGRLRQLIDTINRL